MAARSCLSAFLAVGGALPMYAETVEPVGVLAARRCPLVFAPRVVDVARSFFGARRRHADSSATTTARRGAPRSRTEVLPARPHAPAAGTNALGWARTRKS